MLLKFIGFREISENQITATLFLCSAIHLFVSVHLLIHLKGIWASKIRGGVDNLSLAQNHHPLIRT